MTTNGPNFTRQYPVQILDMALEATFPNGKVFQAMTATVARGNMYYHVLVYREGTSGRWLSSEGISFKGNQRTAENLVRALGYADPISEIYVFPAV